MEDKGKMDELIEQMKLMNERLDRMERHRRRIDFTSEYQETKIQILAAKKRVGLASFFLF